MQAKIESKRSSETSLQDLIRVLLNRKWLILFILIASIGASIYYIRTTPPVYQSHVVMMRESASEKLPASVIGLPAVSDESDRSPEWFLKSSSLLLEIRRRLSKEHSIEIDVDKLGEQVSLLAPASSKDRSGRASNPNILMLTATANIPEHAQAIANVAADTYVEKMTEAKSAELRKGAEFLRQQIAQLEGKIHETEKALNNFREKEGLILTSTAEKGSTALLGTLGNMQSELSRTESDIELTRSQLQAIEKLISEKKRYTQSASAGLSPRIDQLQERLMNLQIELNAKLETLTEKDPEVIATRRKIEVAENQLRSEIDKLLKEPGSATFDPVSELQSLMQQSVTLNVQLKGLERKASLLNERIRNFRARHPELAEKQVELVRLERQSRVYEQEYTTLLSKYQDMLLLEQMNPAGLKVLSLAPLPESPVSPNIRKTLSIGALFGLFLGIMVAFFLEYLDDSIKRKEDAERYLDMPVIGMIPRIKPFDVPKGALTAHEGSSGGRKENTKKLRRILGSSLIYAKDNAGRTSLMESYRSLAMSIRHANKPIRTLLLTSSTPDEGKTITASNLAIAMAGSGMRVLLMDADLRHPRLHRIFQQDRAPGLSDALTNGGIALSDLVRPTSVENLHLVTSGSRVSNSTALLASGKMHELISDLAQRYDITILDSTPLLVVNDAVALSPEVDGVLMVMRSERIKRKIALQGKEKLESVNAKLIGAVLNDVDYSKQYGYYYHRYYNYSSYYKDDGE